MTKINHHAIFLQSIIIVGSRRFKEYLAKYSCGIEVLKADISTSPPLNATVQKKVHLEKKDWFAKIKTANGYLLDPVRQKCATICLSVKVA